LAPETKILLEGAKNQGFRVNIFIFHTVLFHKIKNIKLIFIFLFFQNPQNQEQGR
jgi:hypothetical protein